MFPFFWPVVSVEKVLFLFERQIFHLLQARRHYIYDTQQRTCDAAILELLPDLAKRIAVHFDVETLVKALKGSKEISKEQRIKQWQEVKVCCLWLLECFSWMTFR